MSGPSQKLNVNMSQNLVMTPQLRMAIELLQMNVMDLQGFLQKEMLENPFLESDEGTTEQSADKAKEENKDTTDNMDGDIPEDLPIDAGWESMYDGGSGASAQSAGGSSSDTSWEDMASKELTLRDHLTAQLGMATDDPILNFLGKYLIDSVDDGGYLHLDLAQTAEHLKVDLDTLEQALELIQGFDPIGVGARSLSECLKLQLDAQNKTDEITLTVLDNLELLAAGDLKALSKLADCTAEDMQSAIDDIKALTPKPGLKYGSDVSSNVIPDVVINRDSQGNWKVELNAEAMPKMLIRGDFAAASKSDKNAKSYVTEKMNRAQWLLKSLEQRARTIFKVGQAILDVQRGFFDVGVEHLQPLTLKQVAEKIDVHESTVSRVTSGKYMQTPMGVFELKYFFSSAIGTTGGNTEVASESVKAMIKRLVSAEDKKKPLSDEKLVALLKREGVNVARRTIAKYREALGILSSSKRRQRS